MKNCGRLNSKRRLNREAERFAEMKCGLMKHLPLSTAEAMCGGDRDLVSVVMPVYNGEKYLAEAVRSVLAQTYTRFELIISDDGSSDRSADISKEFEAADKRVRLIRSEKNKGVAAALNAGFAKSRGYWLTWISCDNIMLPEFIEKMLGDLKMHAKAAMVYGNMRLIDARGEILRGKGWYELPPMSGNVMLPRNTDMLNIIPNNTIGAAFMYRRSAVYAVGDYCERYPGVEDYDYWMRMNSAFEIRHTDFAEPLYLYRFHSKSLTAHDSELGITKIQRPLMMKNDRRRRRGLRKALSVCLSRDAGDCEAELLSALRSDPGAGCGSKK